MSSEQTSKNPRLGSFVSRLARRLSTKVPKVSLHAVDESIDCTHDTAKSDIPPVPPLPAYVLGVGLGFGSDPDPFAARAPPAPPIAVPARRSSLILSPSLSTADVFASAPSANSSPAKKRPFDKRQVSAPIPVAPALPRTPSTHTFVTPPRLPRRPSSELSPPLRRAHTAHARPAPLMGSRAPTREARSAPVSPLVAAPVTKRDVDEQYLQDNLSDLDALRGLHAAWGASDDPSASCESGSTYSTSIIRGRESSTSTTTDEEEEAYATSDDEDGGLSGISRRSIARHKDLYGRSATFTSGPPTAPPRSPLPSVPVTRALPPPRPLRVAHRRIGSAPAAGGAVEQPIRPRAMVSSIV